MTATTAIRMVTGAAPGTATNVDGLLTRFNTADTVQTSGTDNALVIPAEGSLYSYWKHYRLEVTGGGFVSINNLRWFTDGVNSNAAGIFWWGQRANVGADAGYRQAVGTPGLTGTQATSLSHTGLVGEPVDVFAWTSASPLALSGSTTGTGLFGDYVMMQLEVSSSFAATGALQSETWTLMYDEV